MSDVTDMQTAELHEGRIKRIRHKAEKRYSGSFANRFWDRLTATDFMSQAMLTAAICLLCFVPFVIVVAAFSGRNEVANLSHRLGLNHEAATDLGRIFGPAHATTAAISGAGYVLFILGGIAAASTIAELYDKIFGLEGRGLKNLPYNLAWLAVMFVGSGLVTWAAPHVQNAGGVLLLILVALPAQTLFWWFTIWILLAGREHWRALFPCALATAICWVGMLTVFHFVFSGSITGDYNKYGPIGVIFALMSFFIAIGVVITLGAVFGLVWREARHPVASADGSELGTGGSPVTAS
jgi:membrane protein